MGAESADYAILERGIERFERRHQSKLVQKTKLGSRKNFLRKRKLRSRAKEKNSAAKRKEENGLSMKNCIHHEPPMNRWGKVYREKVYASQFDRSQKGQGGEILRTL